MSLSVNQTRSLNQERSLTMQLLEALTSVWSKLVSLTSHCQVSQSVVVLLAQDVEIHNIVPSICGSVSTFNSCSSHILLGLFTVCRCLLFLCTRLFGVWMMYNLGTGRHMTFLGASILFAVLAPQELGLLVADLEAFAHHASCQSVRSKWF